MAFQIADLYATIRADDAQLRGSLPRIRRSLDQVHASMQRVAYVARRMFLAISGVIALSVKMASDAEEAHNKFMVVFGNEQLAVTKWAADYGKAVGRAKVDMEAWLAGTQDILVPLGIARHEATGLSKAIVTLGMDIASFSNRADAEVIHNLQSALTGQTRAVLQYGIVVNEAAVKQELLRMGIKQSYADVDNQVKVMARLNVIMAASKDAQGDLMRTQGSFENRLKALTGTWKDFMASLGQAFIPIAGRVVTRLRDITNSLGKWVTANRDTAMTIGLVTLAVTGLLAVLPLLIASLSIMAAHPVIAALAIIGALLSVLITRMYLLKEARKAAFAERVEGKTSEEIQAQIDKTEKQLALAKEMLRADKERQMAWRKEKGVELPPEEILGNETLRNQIKVLEEAQAAFNAELAVTKKAEKAIAEEKKKAAEEVAAAMKAAVEESKAATEAAQKEADALVAAAKAAADYAKGKSRRDAEFARMQAGTAAPAAAKPTGSIMAFDQLARRIQEAALKKEEEKALKDNTDAVKKNTNAIGSWPSEMERVLEGIGGGIAIG